MDYDEYGPFQTVALGLNISERVVMKLPQDWPGTPTKMELQDIIIALTKAGYPPGNGLFGKAKQLWAVRPSYKR